MLLLRLSRLLSMARVVAACCQSMPTSEITTSLP